MIITDDDRIKGQFEDPIYYYLNEPGTRHVVFTLTQRYGTLGSHMVKDGESVKAVEQRYKGPSVTHLITIDLSEELDPQLDRAVKLFKKEQKKRAYA